MNDIQSIEQAKLLFISGLEKLNTNDLIGAEIDFESSLKFYPSRLSTLINLSIVLIKLNKFEDAEKIFQKGLLHHPKNKELLFGLIEIYNILLRFKPEYAEVYVNLGNSYKDLNMYDEALESYNYALKLNPNLAEAYSNKGNILQELNKYIEALANCDKAIAIRANYAEAHLNKGNTLHSLNRLEDAIKSYDCAIEINPYFADAYWNKALALLTAEEFSHGWKLYEWGWKNNERGINRTFTQPLWLGNDNINDKIILLHAEQGLGDTIQFCRYAKLVKELGARVLLEVPKSLLDLLNGLEGVDQLIEIGKQLSNFDYHCPLMSLPLAFKTELSSIPSRTPYLAAANNKHEKWAQKLGVKSKLLVGLVWSGSTTHKNDHNRSLTLQQLLPYLSDLCEYVSLQKEVREIDKQVLDGSNIKQYGDELNDFSDTAALCELMDLVISVDTSVAHLAGAIGKTTWVLLPHVPDWRWLLDREDSPWYPSIKIYRQPSPGDWDSVIQQVRQDLIEYSNNWKLR